MHSNILKLGTSHVFVGKEIDCIMGINGLANVLNEGRLVLARLFRRLCQRYCKNKTKVDESALIKESEDEG